MSKIKLNLNDLKDVPWAQVFIDLNEFIDALDWRNEGKIVNAKSKIFSALIPLHNRDIQTVDVTFDRKTFSNPEIIVMNLVDSNLEYEPITFEDVKDLVLANI